MLHHGVHGLLSLRIKLGGWLLDCILWVSTVRRVGQRKGRKTTNVVLPTPEFLEIKVE